MASRRNVFVDERARGLRAFRNGCEAMVTVTGRVRVVEVEGRHFELEPVADEGGCASRYVLLPLDEGVARLLEASVGAAVRIGGILHEGPAIFMRGPVLRVLSVGLPAPDAPEARR